MTAKKIRSQNPLGLKKGQKLDDRMPEGAVPKPPPPPPAPATAIIPRREEGTALVSVGVELSHVQAHAKGFANRLLPLQQKAANLVVTTKDGEAEASKVADEMKAVLKSAEDLRTSLVRPLNDHVDRINDMFRPLKALVEESLETMRDAVKAFREKERQRTAEEERQRREREEAQRKLAEEQARKLAEASKKSGPKAAPAPPPPPPPAPPSTPPPPPPKTTTSTTGTQTTGKMVWRWKVVDAAKVPEMFKMLNEPAITASVNKGVRQIDGLEIYQEEEITFGRSRR